MPIWLRRVETIVLVEDATRVIQIVGYFHVLSEADFIQCRSDKLRSATWAVMTRI